MKKQQYWVWLVVALLVVVLGIALFIGLSDTAGDKEGEEVEIPQLVSGEREDADTMVLVDAPPVMPSDHARFWSNMGADYTGCMSCHGDSDTSAPEPTPSQHFVDGDAAKGVFKDPQCIQCHATQPYTRAVESEEE